MTAEELSNLAHVDPEAWIEAWSASSELEWLVARFGGEKGGRSNLADRLVYLEQFSACWDYRSGRERNLVVTPTFEPEVAEHVLEAANVLGLTGTNAPRQRGYTHVVILGGLLRACLARPRHAANLVSAGRVSPGRVVGLGGFRPLRGDELTLADLVLGEAVDDEYHAMDAGVRVAFALGEGIRTEGERSDVVGASWAVTDYLTATGLPVHVVAAPSSEPGVRRANTPDTYAWLADSSGWLEPGDDVLLVTTDIYRPYQYADALRMLAVPHAVTVDVVGAPPGDLDPRLAQQFQPHNYLQEIRSTIRSMRLLLAALRSPSPRTPAS